MCFGDGGASAANNQAAHQQQKLKKQEKKREADVRTGQDRIDQAFRPFNDKYYNQYKSDYTGYYFPQLERQYNEANGHSAASLAERGLGESTVGAAQLGDLFRQYGDQRTQIANQAADAATALRGNVEKTKTDLYTLNQASADPQGINARARGEASALVAPQAYSPLGNVFASALDPIAQAAAARGRTPGAAYSSPYSYASGAGSGRVVQ
jgi:hypothetical protein